MILHYCCVFFCGDSHGTSMLMLPIRISPAPLGPFQLSSSYRLQTWQLQAFLLPFIVCSTPYQVHYCRGLLSLPPPSHSSTLLSLPPIHTYSLFWFFRLFVCLAVDSCLASCLGCCLSIASCLARSCLASCLASCLSVFLYVCLSLPQAARAGPLLCRNYRPIRTHLPRML